MPTLSVITGLLRRKATLAVGATLALIAAAALPATASASRSQIAIIQDGSDLVNAPGAMQEFRQLGANTVRVVVPWATIAPSPRSTKKPSFNATDPNAYARSKWAPYDDVVSAAKAYGLTVDFVVTGGTPKWATGPGQPAGATLYEGWKPNYAAYGQFFQAVATRYSGTFTPRGARAALPAVHFWTIYNEPNFGEDLGPQAINGSSVSYAPLMYRGILNAGWSALQRTGHGHDTILIGDFAARGVTFSPPHRGAPQGSPGNYEQTKPLQFIRTLYCVNSSYGELRGSAAKSTGCPTSAAASRKFRSQNPALFGASGVGDHPYPGNGTPVSDGRNDPDFAAFPDLGNLERVLDRVNGVYGSGKKYSIYNDEYGYITNPPNRQVLSVGGHYVSPATGAYYINWAEYLSWKSSRIASYMQYLLQDPSQKAGVFAGFASGLEFYGGRHKPGYDAYRLPVYMPHTSFASSANEEIWGAARPAPFMTKDGNGPQTVSIQLNRKTIKTVSVGAGGYFDVNMKFPGSGSVRLAWTYPRASPFLPVGDLGSTVYSRSFTISVH